jgi:hypothetical protein
MMNPGATNSLRNILTKWTQVKFYVLLALTYAYFYQGADPNQRTRLFLTRALVELRTSKIDHWHGFTIDKSEFAGHFYCDKAPGLSFVLVPIHAALHAIDRLMGIDADNPVYMRVKLHLYVILVCGLSGVAATYFLGRVLCSLGVSRPTANLLQVAYSLGTIVFPFSTALFAHQFVAMLIAAALSMLVEQRDTATWTAKRLVCVGVLFGTSIISEYPSAIIIACMGLYLLSTSPSRSELMRRFLITVAGALPLLALHAIYMKWSFNGFTQLPYRHVFEPFFRVHHDSGILGVNPPTPEGVFGVTVSRYRGLFFFSPFLLFSFWAYADWVRRPDYRRELLLFSAALLGYFVFNSSYYAWDGGGSTGPRHTIPSLLFYVIPIGFLLDQHPKLLIFFKPLVVVSVGIMFACVAVLIHHQEGEVLLSNPLYTTIIPALLNGELGRNTQDVIQLGSRAHVAYNLGALAGLNPLLSLLVIPVIWACAYRHRMITIFYTPRKTVL